MEQNEFLKKYNIPDSDFASSGLEWDKLIEIYTHYIVNKNDYEPAAKEIVERLIKLNKVHSVRYRIKDPEHLIEKIIRKKLESPERNYSIENYSEMIDDIIGIRALHLYKLDWEEIGDFIEKTWDLKERPTANIRKGDPEEIQEIYKAKDYKINEHKYGYRSIHYIIISNPTKSKFISELQVRTIFEEGWSEIDHNIRYPYDLDNPILNGYLNMFNRLAGNADEMGTYIKFLQQQLFEISNNNKKSIKERDEIIKELKSKVEKLSTNKSIKKEINVEIDRLVNSDNLHTLPKSLNDMMNKITIPDFLVSPTTALYNPEEPFFPRGISASSPYIYTRKCQQCGAFANDPNRVISTALGLNNIHNFCPSCNRYLCNNCWPHYNPLTSSLPATLAINSFNTKKCPKCAEDEKKT